MTATSTAAPAATEVVAKMIKVIVGIALMISFTIGVTIFQGFVLHRIWGWFAVPLGIRPIGIAEALGLSTLFGLFTFRYRKAHTEKGDKWYTPIIRVELYALTYTLIAWGVGAAYAHFL